MNPESRTAEHVSDEIVAPVESENAQLLPASSIELVVAQLVADEPGADQPGEPVFNNAASCPPGAPKTVETEHGGPTQTVSTDPVTVPDVSPPNFWLPLCFVAAPVLPISLLLGTHHCSVWPMFVSLLSVWLASNGAIYSSGHLYSLCLTMVLLLAGFLGLALALVLEGRKNLSGMPKILIFVVVIVALTIVVPLLITPLFFPSIG